MVRSEGCSQVKVNNLLPMVEPVEPSVEPVVPESEVPVPVPVEFDAEVVDP